MSTQFQLNNKTILVTGASSGIGRQVAISCSEMGARICITGRDEDRLNKTFQSLKGKDHFQATCDIINETERTAFIESLPAIDGLVHCVGIIMPMPVKFVEEKHIQHIMETNFNSAVLLVSKLLRTKKLNKNSSLIFISSIAAHFPYIGGALYNSSKAAIEAYSRNIAQEMAGIGLRSNCIVPAMVDTPMYEETLKGIKLTHEEYSAKYPLGIGKPEDIANTAIFLLSEASRWITGTNLSLDGGYALTVI